LRRRPACLGAAARVRGRRQARGSAFGGRFWRAARTAICCMAKSDLMVETVRQRAHVGGVIRISVSNDSRAPRLDPGSLRGARHPRYKIIAWQAGQAVPLRTCICRRRPRGLRPTSRDGPLTASVSLVPARQVSDPTRLRAVTHRLDRGLELAHLVQDASANLILESRRHSASLTQRHRRFTESRQHRAAQRLKMSPARKPVALLATLVRRRASPVQCQQRPFRHGEPRRHVHLVDAERLE
jgi:hypothetical protein